MAIPLNPCCWSGHTVDFKLLLRAEIISRNSAGSSKSWIIPKSHACTDFVFLGFIFKTLDEAGKGSLTFPVPWSSNADTSSPAWQSTTGGSWVIICIAYVPCGIEPIWLCRRSLLPSVQIHPSCSGCCVLLLSYFHIPKLQTASENLAQ